MSSEAGRPWPVLCPEDDVIDFMVMEAVNLRVKREEEKAEKDRKRKAWTSDRNELKKKVNKH